ncbi:hypothetical protein [Nocardia spumae]|uniref:hypothetical protein n=1 Tax=Nocardia spumae TaxID=2887190 RepID=UPI001D1529B7|nr:hypothetical protein [Nocardia spumae]
MDLARQMYDELDECGKRRYTVAQVAVTSPKSRSSTKTGSCAKPSAPTTPETQVVAAVARITGGNFRLLQRLFAQIHRVLKINEPHTVTADVVETARSTLVIGAS